MAFPLSLISHHLLELGSRLYFSKTTHFQNPKLLRIGAVREDTVANEDSTTPVINGVNGSINGYLSNGNGSFAKYLNSNGNDVVSEAKVKPVVKMEEKKMVEEIGQEEAWFKQGGKDQLEVSVAPGGRWSRFKTYSTIQRTLEIWGFVLTFIFRVWLSNQKFSYKGGMTEKKKRLRRIGLAKWLKESILRLGPTFIKIGQQFSTRVDILALKNMLTSSQNFRTKFVLFHQRQLYPLSKRRLELHWVMSLNVLCMSP